MSTNQISKSVPQRKLPGFWTGVLGRDPATPSGDNLSHSSIIFLIFKILKINDTRSDLSNFSFQMHNWKKGRAWTLNSEMEI